MGQNTDTNNTNTNHVHTNHNMNTDHDNNHNSRIIIRRIVVVVMIILSGVCGRKVPYECGHSLIRLGCWDIPCRVCQGYRYAVDPKPKSLDHNILSKFLQTACPFSGSSGFRA